MKKKIAGALLAAFILLVFSQVVLADEFSWDTLNSKWDYVENDDAYLMPIRNNEDSWVGYDRGPKRLRDAVSEDWVIETHIANNTEPEGTGSHVGLVIYKDEDNWILWGQEANNATVANGVLGGKGYDIHSIMTKYDYLRIAKTGNRYSFSFSADGETWLQLPNDYVDINHFLDGAQYGLMGKNWEAFNGGIDTPTYYVEFSYFYEQAREAE